MPISRLLVLALSLSAGGGAAWLTASGPEMSQTAAVAAPVAPESVALEEVLVAAADLDQRHRLAPEDLHWQAWPKDNVHGSYVTRSAQPDATDTLAGQMLTVALVAGEPIRPEKLSASTSNLLSARLGPGKRAVAVKVTAKSTAGGFILPEDRVDVIHTTVPDSASGGVSRTIVTNVRVLAVDQQAGAAENASSTIGETATLELDPPHAEIVSAAEATGSLSLALRSTADNGDVQVVANQSERSVQIISAGNSQIATTR